MSESSSPQRERALEMALAQVQQVFSRSSAEPQMQENSAPTVSLAKIAANRQNAILSTGPKTEEGKKRSSKNALKHGLRSIDVVVPSDEPEEFDLLKESVFQRFQPVCDLERSLCDRIVACMWRLQRTSSIETALMLNAWPDKHSVGNVGRAFSYARPERLVLLGRYETGLERSLIRAIGLLRQLQVSPERRLL